MRKPGGNKYHAKRTPCQHGHSHASKREASYCALLHLRMRAGEISGLAVEPTFILAPGGVEIKMGNGQKAKYRPDFTFLEGNRTVAVDVKGFVVRDFPLRAALFRATFPDIELRVVK